MSLNEIIPPEIVNDELAEWLTKLAQRPDIRTILEIGSSSGEGSTKAIVDGMCEAEQEQELFCIEMSPVRFEALRARYMTLPWVHCFQGSSVPINEYMEPSDVHKFYGGVLCNLQKYPLATVLDWLKEDLKACAACEDHNVINTIRAKHDIATWDMAVLDGSAFTGFEEYCSVYGARIIVLDDVNDIKHHASYEDLKTDISYRTLSVNLNLRNGYAIFERVSR